MKKNNSVLVTIIITLAVIVLAAVVFLQSYLKTTTFTADQDFADFLGKAFGKSPRFITQQDFDKVEIIEFSSSEGNNYISIALEGFIEKRDAYYDAYEKASAEGTDLPQAPDFSNYYTSMQTEFSANGFVELENFRNVVEVNISTDVYALSSNLAELSQANKLKVLYIVGSDSENVDKITDISVLSNKTELTDLSITNSAVSDISPLANLSNLKTLAINKGNVTDISALENMKKLTSVSFAENNISDISPLADIELLETVYFDNNNLTDISSLSNKPISMLSLSGNDIVDITPVATLTGDSEFTVISLGDNDISDVSPLAALKDVTSKKIYISLEGNKNITNWSELDELPENVTIIGKPADNTSTQTGENDTPELDESITTENGSNE